MRMQISTQNYAERRDRPLPVPLPLLLAWSVLACPVRMFLVFVFAFAWNLMLPPAPCPALGRQTSAKKRHPVYPMSIEHVEYYIYKKRRQKNPKLMAISNLILWFCIFFGLKKAEWVSAYRLQSHCLWAQEKGIGLGSRLGLGLGRSISALGSLAPLAAVSFLYFLQNTHAHTHTRRVTHLFTHTFSRFAVCWQCAPGYHCCCCCCFFFCADHFLCCCYGLLLLLSPIRHHWNN